MFRFILHTILVTTVCSTSIDAANAESVAKQKGATLTIKGTAEADGYEIDGTGTVGQVTVTIAGTPTLEFFGVRDVQIDTGKGDDIVRISGIQIGGSLRVKTGTGSDHVDLDDTTSFGPVFPMLIGKDLSLRLGGQEQDSVDADVDVGTSFNVGGNCSIDGAADVDLNGGGTKIEYEERDLTIGGNLRIRMPIALDFDNDGLTLDVDSINVGGSTDIRLSNLADEVELTRSTFARGFAIDMRGANDDLNFDSRASRFESTVLFDGGESGDSVFASELVVFEVDPVFKNVEQQS